MSRTLTGFDLNLNYLISSFWIFFHFKAWTCQLVKNTASLPAIYRKKGDCVLINLPKAELHAHLEGTITPEMARKLAARNGIDLPESIIAKEGGYAWRGFANFMEVYDQVSLVIRTPEDCRDVTYDYLRRLAETACLYSELLVSPAHAEMVGMSHEAALSGVVQGIMDAKRDFGIEARILIVAVRHFGVEAAESLAKMLAASPHPLVTGFNLAGDEVKFPAPLFKKTYQIVHEEAGLSCTIHSGEFNGPESMHAALDALPMIKRIGHGVRAVEDPNLVSRIKDLGLVLECCPSSNVATGVFLAMEHHSFGELRDSGLLLTINSDDPPFFATTLDREYWVAQEHFNMDDESLLQITENALRAAFVDAQTKQKLLKRLQAIRCS